MKKNVSLLCPTHTWPINTQSWLALCYFNSLQFNSIPLFWEGFPADFGAWLWGVCHYSATWAWVRSGSGVGCWCSTSSKGVRWRLRVRALCRTLEIYHSHIHKASSGSTFMLEHFCDSRFQCRGIVLPQLTETIVWLRLFQNSLRKKHT